MTPYRSHGRSTSQRNFREKFPDALQINFLFIRSIGMLSGMPFVIWWSENEEESWIGIVARKSDDAIQPVSQWRLALLAMTKRKLCLRIIFFVLYFYWCPSRCPSQVHVILHLALNYKFTVKGCFVIRFLMYRRWTHNCRFPVWIKVSNWKLQSLMYFIASQ